MSGNLNEFGITHLRHVDLAVPDFETQRTFYKDTWGLTEQGKDGYLSYFAAVRRARDAGADGRARPCGTGELGA